MVGPESFISSHFQVAWGHPSRERHELTAPAGAFSPERRVLVPVQLVVSLELHLDVLGAEVETRLRLHAPVSEGNAPELVVEIPRRIHLLRYDRRELPILDLDLA